MKVTAIVFAAGVASAAAFAPSTPVARSSTALNDSIFSKIANMDLWAPVKDSNDYGARNRKKLSQGKIGTNSYVPAGLSADEYNKIRGNDQAKKDAFYQKNVAKAGKFNDYTEFYTKRGTDTKQSWAKSVTKGHDMAKTKYDWSGKDATAAPKWTGLTPKKK